MLQGFALLDAIYFWGTIWGALSFVCSGGKSGLWSVASGGGGAGGHRRCADDALRRIKEDDKREGGDGGETPIFGPALLQHFLAGASIQRYWTCPQCMVCDRGAFKLDHLESTKPLRSFTFSVHYGVPIPLNAVGLGSGASGEGGREPGSAAAAAEESRER